jgi:hypothetical protein
MVIQIEPDIEKVNTLPERNTQQYYCLDVFLDDSRDKDT